MNCCEVCTYWIPDEGEYHANRGVCHRYPPQVCGASFRWPETASFDWCGEFVVEKE